MKKSNLILVFFLVMFCSLRSIAYTATVSGPGAVCAYGGGTYSAHLNFAPITKIVWTCGGAGHFANNTQTFEQTSGFTSDTGGSDGSQYVYWGSGNQVSWVQATFYWSFFGTYTQSGVEYVDIGLPYGPTAINGAPVAICSTKGSSYSYTLTCPNGLAGNSTSYSWSATGGTMSGTGSSATLNPTVGTTPIVVTVKFYSSGCAAYSSGYSITIPRAVGTPAPVTAWFDVVMDDGIHCFNHAFTGGGSYPSAYVWTDPSSQTTTSGENTRNLAGGRTYSISVSAVNDCGTSSPYTYTGSTMTCGSRFADISQEDAKTATNEIKEVVLYPNPTNASFSVNLPSHKSEARIVITNITGQVIQDFYTSDVKLSIETSDIPAGLYMVNVSAQEFSKNQKLEILK